MSDQSKVDPGRRSDGNPFDASEGLYGQEYYCDREAALGRKAPSGTVATTPGDATADDATADVRPDAADLPPDNGRRAAFDPATGEVRGSGSGAGGGNPGEDFASDAAAGDGYPITGGEGAPKRAGEDLGPPRTGE